MMLATHTPFVRQGVPLVLQSFLYSAVSIVRFNSARGRAVSAMDESGLPFSKNVPIHLSQTLKKAP